MGDRPFFKSSGPWLTAVSISAALAVAGIGIHSYLNLRSAQQAEAAAESEMAASPTRQAISALGRIEPKGGVIQVAAPSGESSRVGQLFVAQGDSVQAGQLLAVMDTAGRLEAAVRQAEAEVEEAEQRLNQVLAGAKPADIDAEKANVDRLQVELRQAERDYDRYRRLYESGAISEAELDERQLSLDTMVQQLEQAQQQLESVREVRQVDVELAQSQVDVAIRNLERAQADLENARVYAPISGQVIDIQAETGEAVGEEGILALGNTTQMYVVAEVYETDISQVKVGQRATITSSSFDRPITGVVDEIGLTVNRNDVLSSDPSADIDTRVIEVKIRLNDSATVASLTNLQVIVAIDLEAK